MPGPSGSYPSVVTSVGRSTWLHQKARFKTLGAVGGIRAMLT
jgi:hypothetical protein